MHPVAVVADVQEMFHQVGAQQRDCIALRFVGWPNSDLTKDRVDCQIVVHLFGFTNFCLKRVAKDKLRIRSRCSIHCAQRRLRGGSPGFVL